MKAVLVFDTVNDLIFSKWDDTFLERMKSFNEKEVSELSDAHNVSQLLSPIIASQRVMAAQFGNTYSSMQCKDSTTIVFDEWLDHVVMIISEQLLEDAQRELMDCKTLLQHVCGQNVHLLHSPVYQNWLNVLLECRGKGDSIPGAIGAIGESGATAAALNALKAVSKEIKCPPYHKYHFLLFVGDKLLALYSSRGSEDLSPPDLILLSLQCVAAQDYWQHASDGNQRIPWLSSQNSAIVELCGASASGGPSEPHSLHLAAAAQGVTLAVLLDVELRELGIATAVANQVLANLRRLLLQRNLEMLPATLDSLDAALKKTTDALRKLKSHASLCSRLSARAGELRRACTTTTPLTAETAATALHSALEAVIDLLKPDIPSLKMEQPIRELRSILAPYVDFLQVKAKRCFDMGSRSEAPMPPDPHPDGSLTLHKYLEEFPGLVHFVYVDRTTGRYLAPDMADCAEMISPEMIRGTVRRALSLLHAGYGAGSWRRGALHAVAVQWWERRSLPALPARAPHPAQVQALPTPGDITAAFYRQLTELAFPGCGEEVHVKELVCVHLGLLPVGSAVQQARRLAHGARDLAGESPHDLL